MSKVRDISGLANIIKTDANGNVTFVSGSTTLMAISSSGAVTSTGTIGGSNSSTLATTGSNTFTGQQYVSNTNAPVNFTDTASLYTDGGLRVGKDAYVSGTLYLNNLTVYGTQSVNYITSSQLDIADNIITVNTSTPAIRFGGIAVRDSGSLGTGLTGSLLWDSQNNHWVYTNPSGSSYSGGMMISGPRASSLGEEQGTTFNALMKGQGGDHITSSGIFESGSNMGIGTASPSYKLDVQGTGRFTDALIVNKVAINSGNLNLASFPSLDLIVSGGIGFSSGGSGAAALVNRDGSGNITFYGSSGDIKFTDLTMTSNYLTIKNAGNVGIGTADPGHKLDVNGTGRYQGQLTVTNAATNIPILCNVANQEQYIYISSSVGREAMSRYYNATAGDWYTGIRVSAGLTDTSSYHIYSSTYGNDVLAITTGGTTVVRALGIGINPTQTAALVFADGVGAKILLNNNANNYRIDLVTAVAGGDAMFKFIAGSTGAGEFGFYTGTTLRQLITSDGKQVINAIASSITGYSGPVQSFMINGGSGDGALTLNSSSTGYVYINFAQSLTSKFEIGIVGTGGNGSFYINRNIQTGENGASVYINKSNGNVGILRNNPSYALDVNGDIRSGRLRNNGDLVLNTYTTVNPSSNVFLYSTPNDRDMWIMLDAADTNSNWGIYYRQIDSAVGSLPANSVAFVGGGNNGLRAFINLTNGDYYFGGSNLSDVRSKHNINYISYSAIDKVNALKPATFYYNENPDISKGGFIAQDVKEVLPEFVTNKEDEKHMMGVDYYGIIAVTVKAIQELKAENDTLKEILQRNNIQ
jgi:hypothetical protein